MYSIHVLVHDHRFQNLFLLYTKQTKVVECNNKLQNNQQASDTYKCTKKGLVFCYIDIASVLDELAKGSHKTFNSTTETVG